MMQSRMGVQGQGQKQGVRPLGTAQRLTTAQKKDINTQGVGLQTAMNIENRPVTKHEHGLVGLKNKNQGEGRKIYDKSYYLKVLRQKCSEIYSEINKSKSQYENIQKDNNLYWQLEKRYEELQKEVRNLEGTLADYNLTMDKMRNNARPEDVRKMYEYIKMQNERQKGLLDEIFLERKQQEEEIQMIEQQIQEINQQAEQRFGELDPESRAEYQRMQGENKMLLNEINNQKIQLDEVNQQLFKLESKLRTDTNKLKAQQLKETIEQLDSKRNDLAVQLNEANLSFPEARDRLLARIKEDNQYIVQTDKRIKEIQKINENYERKFREMTVELNDEQQGEEKNKQKYEILYQRDKEITDFINNFETNRQQEIELLRSHENNIVEILEQSSKMLNMLNINITKEEFDEAIKNRDFKKLHADNAEKTLQMLQYQYDQRNLELNKIQEADDRISHQIDVYQSKIQNMKNEIESKFDKVWDIKQQFEQKKNQLIQEKAALENRQKDLVQMTKKLQYEHDLTEKKLQIHENFSNLNDLEKRISMNEQQIYSIKNFIHTKSKDMNYQDIQKHCVQMINNLNEVLIKNGPLQV